MIAVLKRHAGLRVGLISVALTGAILLINAWQDYGRMSTLLQDEYEASQAYLAASTATAVALPLFEYDVEVVAASADALVANEDVAFVAVAEPNGAEVVVRGAEAAATDFMTAPILGPGAGHIGEIRVGYTDKNVTLALASHLQALIVKSFVLVVLLAGVMILALRSIIGPIIKLEAAVREYDVRAGLSNVPGRGREDEIGSLARSFAAQSDELGALFGDLETRVADRTADLEVAVRAAEEASVAKSQFLANMSHEIRTPMNGVLGMTEVLKETALDQSQAEFVDTIYTSGTALVTIINDILDFSKIEAGRLELDPTPFDLRSAIEDVALLLSSAAADKGIELSVRYHPRTPNYVVGDAGRIRQILTNLIGNAVKFTHDGYVLIDVTGGADQDGQAGLTIRVQDTGIGIPEDKQTAIFDEFTQAEESTTRRFGGTGLGLAITRRLVDAMEGDITLESILGVGSVFQVKLTLPVSEASVPEPTEQRDLTGIRALIVDDLAINRSILIEQLGSWGMVPTAVESGEEALKALAEATESNEPYDIAILDYHMPDMDGAMLARAMRDNPAYANTKIVVLSSVDSDANAIAFAETGVQAYLSKPAKSTQLRRTIGRVLGASMMPDENEASKDITPRPFLAAAARPPEPSSAIFAHEPREPGKLYILVAEDNDVNRKVVKTMIGREKRSLTFAHDGKEAYDHFRAHDFDVILMDVSMPVMDGVEATKAIRAYEAQTGMARTPIICLSAHAQASDRARFLDAGMDDYLSKPVSKADLEAKLDEIAARRSKNPDTVQVRALA